MLTDYGPVLLLLGVVLAFALVCPKEAIYMSDELELADYSRASLVYGIDRLRRERSALQGRIDYVERINERW